jgi:hypothetical protein
MLPQAYEALEKITLWADVFGLVGAYLARQADMPASKHARFMGKGERPGRNETRRDGSARHGRVYPSVPTTIG